MSLYIHVPFPATTFSIKGLILAVTVSLWAEINCNRSPNLKTKLLLWTMALTCLCLEYFYLSFIANQLLNCHAALDLVYLNTSCATIIMKPSERGL